MYTVDYFINKFEAIPDNYWCVRAWHIGGAYCANGHCGIHTSESPTVESRALRQIFLQLPVNDLAGDLILSDNENYSYKAALINDGETKEYRQPTPKQRILAALYDIKKIQSTEVKEKIVYVAVPVTITEQAKELVMS